MKKAVISFSMVHNDSFGTEKSNISGVCPSLYASYLYPAVSILVLIWIPTCAIGNIMVLLAILRKKCLQTQANFVLLNVAIADLLVTFVLQPIDYMYYANFPIYPHSVRTTLVWNALFYALLTASVYSLSVLSLERLLAIRFPLRYKVLVTRKGLIVVLFSIWIYAIMTFVIVYIVQKHPQPGKFDYLVPDGFYGGLITLNFLLPLVCMMVAYFYIFRVARRHRRQISFLRLQLRRPKQSDKSGYFRQLKGRKISHSNTSEASNDKEATSPCADVQLDLRKLSNMTLNKENELRTKVNEEEQSKTGKTKRIYRKSFSLTKELKSARLFAVVILCFVLFWSPFLIYQFLFISDSLVFTCEIEFGDQVVSWITYLNSGVNVLVYGAMSRDFRKAYQSLLRMFLFCRKKDAVQVSQTD